MKKRRLVHAMSAYKKLLSGLIATSPGTVNAHTHLDRADTLHPKYLRHYGVDPLMAATYPLEVKQDLVGELHKGEAYTKKSLYRRMKEQIQQMEANGTIEVTSLVDVTTDIGLIALETALEVKAECQNIKFNVGSQPVFGFKNGRERLALYLEAAQYCDVLGGLPEKDDAPGRIGFDGHLKAVLELGCKLGKPVHIHVDQANSPTQKQTEDLVEAVRWIGSPKVEGSDGPTVWAVHVISPSCYEELRFKRLLDQLKKYNIGIICCPRAAISMRQLRPIIAPTHNSIGRLLDMALWEIPIRLGTDNIADIFMPAGSNDLIDELVCLADTLRYYVIECLVKLACGIELNNMDRVNIRQAMEEDYKVFYKTHPDFPRIAP